MPDIVLNKRDSARLFWIFAVTQLVLWTVIPLLTEQNILTDVVEGYVWGHEWQLGTYKHPPLASWILESLAVLTNYAPWAHFLANQLAIVTAFWAVWQTGRRILSEPAALVGALLLVGVVYYNFVSLQFNPNVLQLPLWALMGLSFHRAIKDDRLVDWLFLGLWGAAGMYAKYSSALMLLTLGLLMVVHRDARKRLYGIGPWAALLLFVALMMPHVLWLIHNYYMPFDYAENRFKPLPPGPAFLLGPVTYIFGQVTALAPAVVIYAFSFRRQRHVARGNLSSFDGMFLTFVTFLPSIMVCAVVVLRRAGVHDLWGSPFWNFAGLWVVYYLRPVLSLAAFRRFTISAGLIFFGGLVGLIVHDVTGAYYTHYSNRIHFSGHALADRIEDEWHQRYHTPLRYVVGDIWAAGNVAYYGVDKPHVLINGDYLISPWVTPEDIAKYGAVIVWCRGECTHQDKDDIPQWYWLKFNPKSEIQPVIELPQQTGAKVPPSEIGWAILPPAQ